MLDRMNLIQSLFKQCFFLSHFRQIKDIIVWVTWEYPWREARQGFTTRAQFLGNQALAHLKNSATQPWFLRMLRLDAWLARSPDSIGLPGLRGAPSCTEQLCPVLWTRESTPVSHRLGGRWLPGHISPRIPSLATFSVAWLGLGGFYFSEIPIMFQSLGRTPGSWCSEAADLINQLGQNKWLHAAKYCPPREGCIWGPPADSLSPTDII